MGLKASFATPGNTAYGRCSAIHRWLFGLQRMTDQEGQRLWTRIYSRAFPRPDRHMFMGAPPMPMLWWTATHQSHTFVCTGPAT